MKINRIEIYHLKTPLVHPWRTAYGEDAEVYSVMVKMIAEDVYCWSETTPLKSPFYSPEWSGGVFNLIRDFLAPQIVGKNIQEAKDLNESLNHFKGNPFSKAGLEISWWLLKAKIENKPLHQLLGGRTHPVEVGEDFGVQESIPILLEKIERAINEEYPRIKLKFCPGWDISVLKAVRDQFPNYLFHIDCNSGFTLKDVDLFKKIDRFELAMIEQPLGHTDLIDHAKLQKEIATPICLDESIVSPESAEKAIELGSCRYVNIKTCRVGGLYKAVRIHDLCENAGIPCWVGGMLESAVGQGVSIELATLPNCRYPADIFPSKKHYIKDLAKPEVVLCAPGRIDVSKVAGIPYEPKKNMLKSNTISQAAIGS